MKIRNNQAMKSLNVGSLIYWITEYFSYLGSFSHRSWGKTVQKLRMTNLKFQIRKFCILCHSFFFVRMGGVFWMCSDIVDKSQRNQRVFETKRIICLKFPQKSKMIHVGAAWEQGAHTFHLNYFPSTNKKKNEGVYKLKTTIHHYQHIQIRQINQS